jgi:hypothetical protein
MQISIKLANAPFEEPGARPDWPIIRIDGYLMNFEATELIQPVALVQLKGDGRMRGPLPDWKQDDVVTLTPMVSVGYNDVAETGRCFLDLYLRAQCADHAGWVDGLVPVNPNSHDFTEDAVM